MSRFVLDASIILTWCFPDEESQKAFEISERIAAGDRVAVPAFWRHEMLNALLVGERRKRITPELNKKTEVRSQKSEENPRRRRGHPQRFPTLCLTQAFLGDLDHLPVDVKQPDCYLRSRLSIGSV